MAQKINDTRVFWGGYVDDVQLVKTIDELKEKFSSNNLRFTGLTVTVQNFIDKIPADFWLTEGKFQKNWKLKTIQPLPSFETLASIPSEFLTEGFVVNIKDGTSYKFVGDATEEKDRWQQLPTQDSIDATIDDAVQLAVDKVTSGASEAFDTLGEIEAWINEHSGITEGGKTYKAGDGIQISEDDTISVDENKIKEIVSGDIAEVKDKMDSLSARVTLNEQSIDEVNNTIEKVKTDVKTITDKIDSKNSDIDSLSATVESINASLFLNQEETERVENKLDNFSGDVKTIIDGLSGKTGADGKSAYQIAVENGFSGDEKTWLESLVGKQGEQGPQGEKGTDGKSAFELAKATGYTGSESEWLESLKGKTDFYSAGTGIDITEGVISVKDNYVTDEKLAEKNYLTEVPEDYAKKSDIPSLEGYVTEETLEAKKYLTEVPSEFANKIETVKVDGTALSIAEDKSVNINLSNYAKTTEVDEKYLSKDTASTTYQPKGNYLTEHQSLADYAKTADVEEAYQKKGDYALKSDIIEYSAGDNVVIDGEHKISVASKTIEDIATSALTKALIPDDASESMDTLQEIAAWIQAHPEDAATMNSNISTVSGNVNIISGAVITNNEAIKANSERIDTINSDITKIENSIKNIQEGQVSGGTAVSIEDKIVNVKVAEGNDNFLKVNKNNSLEVKEVTTNKTKTTAFIPVAGGPLAEDVKKVYPDGIPAGSDLQDVLMKLFCKEEWGKTNAPVYTFTASVGQPNINGTGITNGTSYVVGTKVSVGAMINDNITRTQKVEVNGMSYGYSGDTTASTATTYTQTKTPTFAGQETISCTFNGFTEVDKNIDGSAGAIKEFYVGLGNNSYTVNETGKTVSAAEFDSATIYAKSNLGNVSENGVTVSNEGFKASAAYKNGSITPTSTKTITVKGYYPIYYGAIDKVGTVADDLTEEIIKSKSYGENVLTSITLTAGTGTFFMAIPTGKAEFGKSEMITADAGGYSFGKSVVKTMKINMLNNVSQVDYKIFFITNATVLPNNTSYTIKFE